MRTKPKFRDAGEMEAHYAAEEAPLCPVCDWPLEIDYDDPERQYYCPECRANESNDNMKITLKWDGESGDGKRAFVIAEENDGWNDLRIEVDTDDCDSKNAKDMMNEVIRRCNAANEEYMSTETEQLPLEIQLAQAGEEIAGLRRDKARLDWLADSNKCYYWTFQTQPHGCEFEFGEPYLDIRDAIDAAMESSVPFGGR